MGAYGAIGGAALGALENNQKLGEYNRQKQLASDVERNSPWTHQSGMGMMPGAKPDLLGSMMQGATTGASMGMAGGGGSAGGGLGSLFGGGGGAGTNPMAGAQPISMSPGGMTAWSGMDQQQLPTLSGMRNSGYGTMQG